MIKSNENKSDVVVVRILDAPPEQVWKAWSDPEMIKKWWGPDGFTVPVVKMDFREGGVSLVSMQAPPEMGGFIIYNTWTYTRILPEERLEFTLKFTDKDGHILNPSDIGLPAGVPMEVPHVLTFRKVDGKTELTYTEYGYTTTEAAQTSRSGLEQVLDKLAEVFKQQ